MISSYGIEKHGQRGFRKSALNQNLRSKRSQIIICNTTTETSANSRFLYKPISRSRRHLSIWADFLYRKSVLGCGDCDGCLLHESFRSRSIGLAERTAHVEEERSGSDASPDPLSPG